MLTLQVGKRYITRGGWPCDVVYAQRSKIRSGRDGENTTFFTTFLVVHSEDGSFIDTGCPVVHDERGVVRHTVGCTIGNPIPTGGVHFDHPADIVKEA